MAAAELNRLLALADPASAQPPAEALAAATAALHLARAETNWLPQRARAAVLLCTQLFRQGRLQQARDEAAALLAELPTSGVDAERCELLRLLSVSCCEGGWYGPAFEAARALDEAATRLDDGGWRLIASYTLGACLDRIGDPWQATRVLADALRQHGDAATPRQRLIAQIGLCAFHGDGFHRLGVDAPAAERDALLAGARPWGEAAVALLPQVNEPLFSVAALGNLGELCLHQGDAAGARRLLQEALRIAHDAGLRGHHWRAQASWGEWLLRYDSAEAAAQAMAALAADMADMGDAAPPAVAARLHDVARRAHAALGQFDRAYTHLQAFERLERRRTLAELRAQSELFVTRVEAERSRLAAETARHEAHRQQQRAEQDPLTGLGNRAHLARRVAELGSAGLLTPAMLALLDVDHFKQVNDAFGHAAGDAVLAALAQMLRDSTRSHDVLARIGGEEFAIVLVGTEAAAAREVCERLRRRVAQRTDWPELPAGCHVSLSIGLAAQPAAGLDAGLRLADEALYAAKRAGRDRVHEARPP